MSKAAFLKELTEAMAERAAPAPSRIGMDFKDVTKRIPELTEAAQRVKAGEMGRSEYAELVQRYKPVEPYTSVPKPATLDEIYNAVTANKRDKVGKIGDYEEGRPVSLRLDIPAYKDHGVWAPTIHDLTDNFKSIAHEPAAHISGGRFDIPQGKSLNVAAGANKSPFASIDGKLRKTPVEDIQRMADEALNSDDWVQVGMDPERHGYFYDRRTMQPVVEAEEVIQVGPLVLAKKPKYGDPDEYMYNKGGIVDAIEAEGGNGEDIPMPAFAEGGGVDVDGEESWLDSLYTYGRNAADKATYGTAKYAAAAGDYSYDTLMDALGYENQADYDRSLAEQVYALKEGEEKQPLAAGLGDVTGYVAPYLAVGPAQGALSSLGQISDYGSKVSKTGSLLGRAFGFAQGGRVRC